MIEVSFYNVNNTRKEILPKDYKTSKKDTKKNSETFCVKACFHKKDAKG